jgi:glucose/arabinose dehydrogenase
VGHASSRVLAIAVLIVVATTGLSGAAASDGADDGGSVSLDQLTITSSVVATGLVRPTAITAPDDGSNRLFITEKSGTVRVFHPDTGLAAEPLLDISDRVDESGNERGLLGIAAAPDFTASLALYVAYTRLPDGAVTLSRFPLDSADQQPVPAGGEEIVLAQEHAMFSNHNGGQLAFGLDGFLYWGIGDGGSAGDPDMNGQNLGTLLGKILRLDVSRACDGLSYCIPADNPFLSDPGARPEIWAYGLRNPWRFSFDAENGSLWIADVGQNSFEEVNHRAGGDSGVNFGWSCREGPEVFEADRCLPDADLADPVFWYPSADGCAVIGGFVYRGEQFAELAGGTYIGTDYCSATAWGITVSADGSHVAEVIGELPNQVTTFGVDSSGELYAITDRTGQLLTIGFAPGT